MFSKRFLGKSPALFKSGHWNFHQDNTPVDNSILVTDYLTKMGIKTVLQPPYSKDLTPCDFWLFSKLRGCRYKTIEEMKEGVTKVIDTLTQEDFDGAFQKLLEQYNKCIVAEGDYFEGDLSFMCVLSIKVHIRKKSGNLFKDPRTKQIHTHVCIFLLLKHRPWIDHFYTNIYALDVTDFHHIFFLFLWHNKRNVHDNTCQNPRWGRLHFTFCWYTWKSIKQHLSFKPWVNKRAYEDLLPS